MKLNLQNLELSDVILFIGVIGSIFGASSAYTNSTSKIETAMDELKSVKSEVIENRKLNYDQNVLLRDITVNMQHLAETIREIKEEAKENKKRR